MGIFKRGLEQKTGKLKYYWYGRVRVNGRLKLKSFGLVGDMTKAMAEADFVEWRRKVKKGRGKIDDPTLAEFADEYLRHQRYAAENRAWDRDELCIKHFIAFFGPGRKLSNFSVRVIDDYKRHRLEKVQRSTVQRELECLRRMFNLAALWDQFEGDNPVSRAGLWRLKNQRNRVLSLEEQRILLPALHLRARRIIELILKTGMRSGEVVFLKKFSVHFDTSVIRLIADDTKEDDYKDIPLTPSAVTILREAIQGNKTEYVFLSSSGKPYESVGTIRQVLQRACRTLGIPHITVHDLRHTWASRALEGKHGKKANLRAIQKVLGHKDVKTTMRYLHVDQSLREAVQIVEDYEKDEE